MATGRSSKAVRSTTTKTSDSENPKSAVVKEADLLEKVSVLGEIFSCLREIFSWLREICLGNCTQP